MASRRANDTLTAEPPVVCSSEQQALQSCQPLAEAMNHSTLSEATPHSSLPDQNADIDHRQGVIDVIMKALQAVDGGVTDIESVLDKTNLSNEAVLKHFENMHAVVIALVESLAEALSRPLKMSTTSMPLRETLIHFGKRITAKECRWQLISLYRIALTESIRNREAGGDFYHRGPGRVTAELARIIERHQVRGTVRAEDSYVLASQFMALLRVNLDEGNVARTSGPSHVFEIVDLFCSGLQTGASHAHADD